MFTKEEALHKLGAGMYILIREGSAAKNFEALIDLLHDHPDKIMFCSDDKHPDSLEEGHINQLCIRAVAKGIDVFKVLKAACINPVRHYRLPVGLLKPGDAADLVMLKDLRSFSVLKTFINGEWAWVNIDVPETYTEQFGRKQQGGFVDVVQPIIKRPWFGFESSVLNAALRLEYVDWNKGVFKSTGGSISDHVFSIVPAISWRPVSQTVFRLNYRYNWQTDLLGNPPSKLAGFQFGLSTYF